MALENAVAAVARLVGTIPGMRGSPSEPPEKLTYFPFAITTPLDGEWTPRSQGEVLGLHRIGIWVHTARKDLPRDVERIIPYGELVKDLILAPANTRLPDAAGLPTASAIIALRYVFGPLGYETVKTLGWAFELEIKLLSTDGV